MLSSSTSVLVGMGLAAGIGFSGFYLGLKFASYVRFRHSLVAHLKNSLNFSVYISREIDF